MSENSTMNSTMAEEPSTKSLKEALLAQQRLLQKLYNELDVEREAAATAASEAMSMILRLQGEKAAVTMEAEQYKRLVEEKMIYAEESMETFEEIMYQKEMEIASLDYQVQAYRYRLLSLGVDDLGVHEIKFPENLLQRNESLAGETSSKTPPKRLNLPNLKKGHMMERDRSIAAEDSDMIAKIVEESLRDDEKNQSFDFGFKAECSSSVDISSYLEQIRELDKVVEEMTGDPYVSSPPKAPSKVKELDLVKSIHKPTDEKIEDTCSPSVCDVFEVPLIEETLFKDEGKSIFKDAEKAEKGIEKAKKGIEKAEKGVEKVKRLTSLPQLGLKPCSSFYKDECDSGKKSLNLKQKDRKGSLVGDGVSVDCCLTPNQLHTTSEIAKGETKAVERNVRHERVALRDNHELRLLYEINEKLNVIHSEIRSRNMKVGESSSGYEQPMLQLREAMQDLWF